MFRRQEKKNLRFSKRTKFFCCCGPLHLSLDGGSRRSARFGSVTLCIVHQMDLGARSVSDLQRVAALVCTRAPRSGIRSTKAALVQRTRGCAKSGNRKTEVVSCASPLIPKRYYDEIREILESLSWSKHEKLRKEDSTRSHSLGSASFVLGSTTGPAGADGFKDVMWRNGKRFGYNHDITTSRNKFQERPLRRLWRVLKKLVRRVDPSYRFTSVQVNKNFAGRVHTDKKDVTYQYALSVGDFSGGNLVVSTDDPYLYVKMDTKRRLTRCDGRHPHWVTAHKGGTRYSLVMYNITGKDRPRGSNLDRKGMQCSKPKRYSKTSEPRK